MCIIGIIGCVVAINKLDSRLDNVENYQYEQQGGHNTSEITGILDSEPYLESDNGNYGIVTVTENE